MKRTFLSVFITLIVATSAFAQGEIDALRYSRNDLTGTARSVGMGGAFGALGGDVSGIAINPAGIGVYKSSEIVGTLSFNNHKSEAKPNTGKLTTDKFAVDFDNLAIVGAFPLDNTDVPFINFGFSYNKLKSFDRKYQTRSNGLSSSLTHYMAERATDSWGDVTASGWRGDWMGKLGYEGYLTDYTTNAQNQKIFHSVLEDGEKVNNNLYVREKGEISSYDFNVGTTFADMLSLGLSLSLTDLNYDLYSSYSEDFAFGDGFKLENVLETRGTGFQLGLGMIFKPINEIRLGVAYHSPTWYNFTDRYYADLRTPLVDGGLVQTPDGETEYDFKTPDRWTLSLAGVIGRHAIVSVDYELTNYKNSMKYRNIERDDYLSDINDIIKQDFKNASTVRIGAEIRITPQLSGRVGYAWMQSPFGDVLKDNEQPAAVTGTVPHYVVEGDANHITWGLGYRFTPQFYVDVAFVVKNQKNDLYAFPKYFEPGTDNLLVDSKPVDLNTNTFSGLLTFGYRF